MKVSEIMTKSPVTCAPTTNLAEVAANMFKHDCGSIPVVDAHGKLVGIITDRDICIAVGTRNRCANEITVGEVMQSQVHACKHSDDISDAMTALSTHRVRRLPVVDGDSKLVGILGINDIILSTLTVNPMRGRDPRRPSSDDVLETLKHINAHWTGRDQRIAA